MQHKLHVGKLHCPGLFPAAPKVRKKRTMPTGSRLVAALSLSIGCLCMYFVMLVQYPDANLDYHQKELMGLLAAVGFIVGWKNLGVQAMQEDVSPFALGLRATVTCAIWIVILLAIRHIVDEMIRHGYSDPVEAVQDMFGTGLEIVMLMFNLPVIIFACIAGLVAGALTDSAAKTWS